MVFPGCCAARMRPLYSRARVRTGVTACTSESRREIPYRERRVVAKKQTLTVASFVS